jgi:hypothetical protein
MDESQLIKGIQQGDRKSFQIYNLIVNSAIEKGKQYRMNGQNGNGQGKGNGRNEQGNRGNGTCRN